MSHNTHLLKEILAVARDGVDFYDKAQLEIQDPNLQRLFGRMADAKRELITGLSGQLRDLGGEPPRFGTALGSIRETYTKMRATLLPLLGRDDAKLYTDELEQTEDRLLAHVRNALKEADPDLRAHLQGYLPEVQACHDEMRNLKQRMAAQPTVH